MGNEIKENIVTRVKKELGISDAVDDLALYEFLCKRMTKKAKNSRFGLLF